VVPVKMLRRVTASVPQPVYAALRELADEKGMRLSHYLCNLLSNVITMKATVYRIQDLTEALTETVEQFDSLMDQEHSTAS